MASKRKKKHSKDGSTKSLASGFAAQMLTTKDTSSAFAVYEYRGKTLMQVTTSTGASYLYGMMNGTYTLLVGPATGSKEAISRLTHFFSNESMAQVSSKNLRKKSKKSSKTSRTKNL